MRCLPWHCSTRGCKCALRRSASSRVSAWRMASARVGNRGFAAMFSMAVPVELGEGGGLVWLIDQHRSEHDRIDGFIIDPQQVAGRCLHEPAAVEQSTLRGQFSTPVEQVGRYVAERANPPTGRVAAWVSRFLPTSRVIADRRILGSLASLSELTRVIRASYPQLQFHPHRSS
jgi:hypothetical protein